MPTPGLSSGFDPVAGGGGGRGNFQQQPHLASGSLQPGLREPAAPGEQKPSEKYSAHRPLFFGAGLLYYWEVCTRSCRQSM